MTVSVKAWVIEHHRLANETRFEGMLGLWLFVGPSLGAHGP
jgi:hypothetical protein